MKIVGIASCSHYAWLESSKIMVENLANEVECGASARVHVPVDSEGLIACMSESDYFIIHTHGTFDSFIDQRANDKQVKIASLSDVENFPSFPNLKLVIITACSTAGGENSNNIAAALSTKIAKNGLVIANRYRVFGSCYDFGEEGGKQGWIGYRNGKAVLFEKDLPANITMADGYKIYRANN